MDNVYAINNFFYFIYNISFIKDENGRYYPELILKADWPCQSLDHIKEKWMHNFRGVDGNDALGMFHFYADIDNSHRRVMTEWILDNYDCGYHI